MNRKICPRCRSVDIENFSKALLRTRFPSSAYFCKNCGFSGRMLELSK